MAQPPEPAESPQTNSFVELLNSSYHDDLEDPTYYLVADGENVFDYIMFIGPTEFAKHHSAKATLDVVMGYALVFMTLFLQGLLLTAVYDRVVLKAISWQKGIVTTQFDRTWNLLESVEEESTKCNTGSSICTMWNSNKIECAPPSIRLMGKWSELDSNGDGVWTREEAKQAQDEIVCKYTVNPLEVFDTVVSFVMKRKKLIWVHPDIRQGNAIPKTYFNYAMGDIIMCGYRNEAMCRNVLQHGFFDAPLKYGTVPRVGNTTMSAIDYCIDLLREGGTCDRALPSTYSVWKIQSDEECGAKFYTPFVYQHPKTGNKKSVLSVDYEARQQAEKIKTLKFKLFQTLIVMIWVMSMVFELKRLMEVFTWLIRMPGEAYCRERNLPLCSSQHLDDEEADHRFKINGLAMGHRAFLFGITVMRLVMLVVLTIVGINLLLNSPSYMSLLFDAISLVFILELACIIAKMVLREPAKEQASEVKPIQVLMFGPLWLTRRQSLIDLAWFFLVVVIALLIMHYHYTVNVGPLEEALKCTCLGIGENCVEAQKFNYDFWYRYWKEVTPQVFKDVDTMKEEHDAGATALLDVTPLLATAATNSSLWTSSSPHVSFARRSAHAVLSHRTL